MGNKNDAIQVKDILDKDIYTVPIYQRNYEWEKEQISKLIEDINNISENENYYLGTLVTFKRKDGQYELIDGQQRHTTLNLIKSIFNERPGKFNLKFQSRSECEMFFNFLTHREENDLSLFESDKSKNLNRGSTIIVDVFKDQKIKIEEFKQKFYNQTYVFRTELPDNTDLNHYFEIMNNRGEQLEKHEILKAQLMEVFTNDDKKSEAFSKIWDACSYMGDYVWNNFEKDLAIRIFTESNEFSFENFSSSISLSSNHSCDGNQLFSIIKSHLVPDNFSQKEQEKTDKFRSVLDFSEFLLYTYYLFVKGDVESKFSFDDKKLLDVFKDFKESEMFIIELLKLRIYFDQNIIKNEIGKDSKWGIRTFKIDNSEIKLEETAFENSRWEDKIEMLQAMFYYSSISNDRKDWLLSILESKPKTDELIYNKLFATFKDNIKDINIEEQNYPDVLTKTFYYFEYMLWEIYYEFLRGEIKSIIPENLISICEKIEKNKFQNYKFRQLSSKEHLLPQSKAIGEENLVLNDFGNLCLISSSQNSSANDDHPKYKRQNFGNDNSSLKRLVMFETYSGEDYTRDNIKTHESEMNIVLEFYKNKI